VLIALAWCAAGLALLILGAELIVRGGTDVAARLGVPPLVLGLTIVAVGTSTPELAVGIDAALRGEGELAVGNIAGTNIVNMLLILGLSALIRPLAIPKQTIRLDLPVIVLASLMLAVAASDGVLSRTEGIVFVTAALVYTLLVLRLARRGAAPTEMAFTDALATHWAHRPLLSAAMLAIGIAVIVVGADWLVDGAVALARQWRVSEAFIGLTIVAIGTSAPELATTLLSTIRNSREIAIGNLFGSSIYNILAILGIICLVPSTGIPVAEALIKVDIPLMAAVTLLCVPVFLSGRRITRIEGAMFVSAYVAYLVCLIAERG